MAEKAPGEPPSRWVIINDYSKTVVTVCAALLAFLAAFSGKLQGSNTSAMSRCTLYAAILALGLSALAALAVPAKLECYLRVCAKGAPAVGDPETATPAEWNARPSMIWWCKFAANISYLMLAVAVIALAVYAGLMPGQARDEATALTSALDVTQRVAGIAQPKLLTQSFDFVDKEDAFELIIVEQTTGTRFRARVPRGGSPVSVDRIP